MMKTTNFPTSTIYLTDFGRKSIDQILHISYYKKLVDHY